MAEYYPLISRAVGGLEDKSGEKRRALYERARSALITQLRNANPPLDEAQITRERLALEDAIRRVEAEAAKAEEGPPKVESAPSLRDQALRDFRESVAEAEGLGGAAADATATLRAVYEQVREPARDVARKPAPRRLFEPPATEPPPPDFSTQEPEPPWSPPAEPAGEHYYKKAPVDWTRIIPIVLILALVGAVV